MACQACKKNLFKEKLGRCKTCMWLNVFLLTASAVGWLLSYQAAPRQIETIALLITFIASALLMSLHIAAYLYYRCRGIKKPTEDLPTQDKQIPK